MSFSLSGPFLSFRLGFRRYMSSNSTAGLVNYQELCSVIEANKKKNNGSAVVIDVRGPGEVKETGLIPTAHNIPLDQIGSALAMPDADFKAQYGFNKPKPSDKIIFYCKVGKRCQTAASQTAALGYTAASYPGSWTEWSDKCKK